MQSKLQPVLSNDFLVLRPLIEEDFSELFSIASDPLIWEQHQKNNRYKLEEFTEFFNQGIASKAAFAILDKKSNKIIGSSRYKVFGNGYEVVEIGWSFLGRSYWGGTFNREFKKLMINHALQFYKQIVFYVHVQNYRSQRAMLKIGGRKIEAYSADWVRPFEETITYIIDQPLNY